MSAVVLPSPPREVPVLEADPATVRDFAGDLLAASTQVDDLGSFSVAGGRVDDWEGRASRAYHEAVQPLGRLADAMSLALRAVGRRTQHHGDVLDRLLDDRQALAARGDELSGRVERLRSQVASGAADGPALEEAAARLRGLVASLDDDIAAWAADLADEEATMRLELGRLRALDQAERSYAGTDDPADAALATRPPSDVGPAAAREWWQALTPEQQQAVTVAAPGVVGNLDGLPAAARDAANRLALDRDLADLGWLKDAGLLTAPELGMLASARAARRALARLAGRADPVTGRPVASRLHTYDPAAFGGDGRVAVAVGDPDTADNVAVSVPGFGSDATSIALQTDRALNIHDAARLDERGDNGSVAVLAWVGYDAPDLGGTIPEALRVADRSMAAAGGELLADAVDGLVASRPDDPAHLTVIGHSYGSTTVAMSGTAGVPADAMVLTGSPGAGDAGRAADLSVTEGRVYVISASRDPVTRLGGEGWVDPVGTLGLGANPATHEFGAVRLQGESVHRADPGVRSYGPFSESSRWLDHHRYYDHDTESLRNIAQVVNADYDDLATAGHRSDPWWWTVRDPEAGRVPTAPDTDGWS